MAVNAAKAVLKQGKTVLLICDVQEKFAKAMYEFGKITQNSVKLINALKLLNVPTIVSEQNPKALGKTIPEFDISGAKGPFEKTQFSMCIPEINKELSTICSGQKPDSIILIGIETHVCIENTAIDLRQNGYEVHTVADCCTSRTQEDRLLALERMKRIGCHIATSENVIFKLLADAKHKEFKNIQSLVKTPTQQTNLVPVSQL
ncbi:isochorismatase domain-containing protein 2 [Apis mellifera caucasica]|uniref:Isochorismatase domain-containing protein 1 n=1 Tax=Apis mellifera TaxID=7460 RepID=A0A7M7TF65_APIME|nr:isochorismatase domain-containing protein 2 [Apis mellifera]KAG6797479.1 isochorismatase domain-containing protein 2 [Apis mellifera caucasica]KAG9428878.1 isochorismatase domain-containing protein 2 [Apis mellifera carnica]|eukprot:XP_393900.2 isochorismatase domain-containing protein 2 [Apis mellifera]